MIGVDWGTTSLRAYRLAGREVVERRASPRGITRVPDGRFEAALREVVGDWLAEGERRVLMSGMIGSRQGWVEAAYLPCPTGAAALAAGLVPVPFEGAAVAIVPGVSHVDAGGVPEVMRGEETQLAAAGDGLFCLPGTHSKWATVTGGEITGFETAMTGEVFAALRGHTILGRLMADGSPDGSLDEAAFRRGVARAGADGGLLHHLFGVRALGLFGRLSPAEAGSYLSGLLIGSEVAVQAGRAREAGAVRLIGEAGLCRLYAVALEEHGASAVAEAPDRAAGGLAAIGEMAGWA